MGLIFGPDSGHEPLIWKLNFNRMFHPLVYQSDTVGETLPCKRRDLSGSPHSTTILCKFGQDAIPPPPIFCFLFGTGRELNEIKFIFICIIFRV